VIIETFGIRSIYEIANRLNADVGRLIKETAEYFNVGATCVEYLDVLRYLEDEHFDNYISLCNDISLLKRIDEDYYDGDELKYDLNNIPMNNHTIIVERIKELENINKVTDNSNNITLYVPTARQANEQAKKNRQPQINKIIDFIKPAIEEAINKAIKYGEFEVTITDLFTFNSDTSKILKVILNPDNASCTILDYNEALYTVLTALYNKGYYYETGTEDNSSLYISWSDERLKEM
jgi:hypothetical protein